MRSGVGATARTPRRPSRRRSRRRRDDRPAALGPSPPLKATAKKAGASKTEGQAEAGSLPKPSSGKAGSRRTAARRRAQGRRGGRGHRRRGRQARSRDDRHPGAAVGGARRDRRQAGPRGLAAAPVLPLRLPIGRAAAGVPALRRALCDPGPAVAAPASSRSGRSRPPSGSTTTRSASATTPYSGRFAFAPPPEVSSDIAGQAHAWVMLPLASWSPRALLAGTHRPPPRRPPSSSRSAIAGDRDQPSRRRPEGPRRGHGRDRL